MSTSELAHTLISQRHILPNLSGNVKYLLLYPDDLYATGVLPNNVLLRLSTKPPPGRRGSEWIMVISRRTIAFGVAWNLHFHLRDTTQLVQVQNSERL
jgi:hypothetical protein